LSEHQAFVPKSLSSEAQNKSKKAAAKPKAKNSDSDSDASSSTFASLKEKKKPAKAAGKQKNALFHVKWWRVVLGPWMNVGPKCDS
jgi:hypothetical protein